MIPFGSSGGSQDNVKDVEVVMFITTFLGGPLGAVKQKKNTTICYVQKKQQLQLQQQQQQHFSFFKVSSNQGMVSELKFHPSYLYHLTIVNSFMVMLHGTIFSATMLRYKLMPCNVAHGQFLPQQFAAKLR